MPPVPPSPPLQDAPCSPQTLASRGTAASDATLHPLARFFLRLYAPVVMMIGLGGLAALCLLWYPFAMLIGFLPLPGKLRRRLGRWVIYMGLRFYIWVLRTFCFIYIDLDAVKPLRQERALIIVANHPSLIDAVIIMSVLPNAVCVMKAALQNNILYGAATRLAHYVSNASPLHMIRNACEELQQGAHLVIFPESTRTTHWPVNPCSAASAVIAQRSQVPMQEIFIDMNVPYLGKRWPLFRPPVLPWRITLHAGRRIDPASGSAMQITQQFERDVRAHFGCEDVGTHVG